ncbi:unnamed protein product [Lactuca virosa]|uniref:Calponin-homology (CH) domain-containing protein n=1 Tax=Lactuca virosa TaxID=75947 RepID=A0AAU9PDN1_9ASTR|nr:unnamed protein product [Lactuca virosa]
MEPKQQTQQQKLEIPSSPLPHSSSSSFLLRDISNFKTPKPRRQSQANPSFNFESPCPQFFSALKQTPKSSHSTVRRRPRFSLAAQKLKAVELEQSKSSRKTQTDKEKSLKSLAKSLTVWLNFLFENPRSCGVDVSRFTGEDSSDGSSMVFSGGKRDSVCHDGIGVDREWRGPKRRKDTLWIHKGEVENNFSSSIHTRLQVSLEDVCSLDDMKERMSFYLSLTSCKEIFDVMTHVTKNIDEGRLKMKAHCPIVTDVGMKENALKILMCYNPVWLRIGLYIIFGGESLLPNPNTEMNYDQEISFLKMVAEKLFFSHSGLAKAYIYNKLVEGLYRPGYYEKLGSIILKKFLLLVIILDRAKSQSSLPISYGIDGVDGGSPLLFTSRATIKSSSEVISDFLSPDVMHGVGNLLTHLMIIGYKVSYRQNPLVKYVFKVTDLFNDLQNGVLLCRVIQLLQHDPSILKKVVVPSDDRKKNFANCEISLKYLKKIGVPLCDEDGVEIITEDIVNGDKELIISLLWNIFVHLQLPLLINNKLLSDEITKIRGLEEMLPESSSSLQMLLEWIKAVCENYDLKVDNFASLVDGKAMWCVVDYYFRKEHCNASSNKNQKETNEVSLMSASDYVDAVHNFLLSQKLTTLLGNFPEILQVSDILEYKGACSDRGVIILLVFLSSQLIVKRNLQQINFHKLLGHNQNSERKCIRRDRLLGSHEETCQNHNEDNGRKFKAIMSWWKEMAQHNSNVNVKPVYTKFIQERALIVSQQNNIKCNQEKAALRIQFAWRKHVNSSLHNQRQSAATMIQTCYSGWMLRKSFLNYKQAATKIQACYRCWMLKKSFLSHKQAATKIQACYRCWILKKSYLSHKRAATNIQSHYRGFISRQSFLNQKQAATKIQAFYRCCMLKMNLLNHKQAATQIQAFYRCWMLKKKFLNHKQAATQIQAFYRCWMLKKSFLNQKQAAMNIQSHYRGFISRKSFLNHKQAATRIQSHYRGFISRKSFLNHKQAITKIQSHYHGMLLRKSFLNHKQATIKIQSYYRGLQLRKSFLNQKEATIKIQSHYHGMLLRKNFLNQKQAATRIQSHYRGWVSRNSFLKTKQAVIKVQRVYRSLKCLREFKNYKLEIKSAVIIQSCTRGWIARRIACRHRSHIMLIQSYCRGWLMRREFLLQKSAAMRIQSAFRCFKSFKAFKCDKNAAIVIQQCVRECITRKRLLGCNNETKKDFFSNSHQQLKTYTDSATKLQKWWRGILLSKTRTRTKSAILIQSNVRGWISRRTTAQRRHRIAVIQSYWKGYIERKHSREKVSDIRLRVQKSAANVDDGMRIINRLIAALSQLKNTNSLSGILHICATLDMATKHSQKCCEELVAAGAIDTLLGLIRSISRSIAEQEVLRYTLSTFRNLTCHPHLTQPLIDARGSIETIFWEFIRNKEDAYFVAGDVLRNICLNKNGVERLGASHALVKRLYNLVEDLKRKAGNEKRNPQTLPAKEQTGRRLKEAVQILKLITNG